MKKQPFRNYTVKNIPEADYKRLRVMAAEQEISINTLLLNIIEEAAQGPKGYVLPPALGREDTRRKNAVGR